MHVPNSGPRFFIVLLAFIATTLLRLFFVYNGCWYFLATPTFFFIGISDAAAFFACFSSFFDAESDCLECLPQPHLHLTSISSPCAALHKKTELYSRTLHKWKFYLDRSSPSGNLQSAPSAHGIFGKSTTMIWLYFELVYLCHMIKLYWCEWWVSCLQYNFISVSGGGGLLKLASKKCLLVYVHCTDMYNVRTLSGVFSNKWYTLRYVYTLHCIL